MRDSKVDRLPGCLFAEDGQSGVQGDLLDADSKANLVHGYPARVPCSSDELSR